MQLLALILRRLASALPERCAIIHLKTSVTLSKVITFTRNVRIMQPFLLFHLCSPPILPRPLFHLAGRLDNPLFNERSNCRDDSRPTFLHPKHSNDQDGSRCCFELLYFVFNGVWQLPAFSPSVMQPFQMTCVCTAARDEEEKKRFMLTTSTPHVITP